LRLKQKTISAWHYSSNKCGNLCAEQKAVPHSIREALEAGELRVDMKRVYIAGKRSERVEIARSNGPIQLSHHSDR
jgi:hypothetical protein